MARETGLKPKTSQEEMSFECQMCLCNQPHRMCTTPLTCNYRVVLLFFIIFFCSYWTHLFTFVTHPKIFIPSTELNVWEFRNLPPASIDTSGPLRVFRFVPHPFANCQAKRNWLKSAKFSQQFRHLPHKTVLITFICIIRYVHVFNKADISIQKISTDGCSTGLPHPKTTRLA